MGEKVSAQSVQSPAGFRPKAKSVIYLQQCGGPPHVDLFDFKPELVKRDGEPTPESLIKGERFAFITGTPKLQKSPFDIQAIWEIRCDALQSSAPPGRGSGRCDIHQIHVHDAV